jgi:hypothetical protein
MSKIQDRASLSTTKPKYLIRFLRPSLPEWDWDFPFLGGSSRITAVIFGSPKQVQKAVFLKSLCQCSNKRQWHNAAASSRLHVDPYRPLVRGAARLIEPESVRGAHRRSTLGAQRRFACEAFAQEPINHLSGLNLKLGWCGLHDCAGPPSLLARNPVKDFGRGWWVVDVAVDRGAIRHDLFPKQSGLQRKPRSKRAIGWGYSQLDQRTLFLSTMSQWPPATARAIYANPADALWRGSISDFAENGFSR